MLFIQARTSFHSGLAAAAASFLLLTGVALAQEPIKIGTFLSSTGPAAFLGDPELKTLQMYVEKLNASGGLLGRKLQLISYDDGGDADKARTFAKRLIEQDKVDVIVGGSTTGTTMAVVPLVEQMGVPFISFAAAVEIIEPVKKWVFKSAHTDRMQCERIFLDMRDRKIERIGLISSGSGYDKSMRAQCLKVAPNYKVSIVADETYGDRDTDMTAQLIKIKNSPGVQAVLSTGYGPAAIVVIKNLRQLAIGLPLYLSAAAASKEFITLGGEGLEGARLPAPALLIAEQLSNTDPQKQVVVAYKREYVARYKEEVSGFGGYAYDGLMLAVQAIRRAGSTKKDAVRDALENIKDYIGVTGLVTMSPKDHLGLDSRALRMLEVKKGDWALVK